MTYLRLGIAVVGLLALIGAFFYGASVGRAQCENDHAEEAAAAVEDREGVIIGAQDDDLYAAQADTVRDTTVREIYREVPRIVERPVYRNVCFDDDGVRALNRAVEAANGRAAASGSDDHTSGIQPSSGIDQPGNR